MSFLQDILFTDKESQSKRVTEVVCAFTIVQLYFYFPILRTDENRTYFDYTKSVISILGDGGLRDIIWIILLVPMITMYLMFYWFILSFRESSMVTLRKYTLFAIISGVLWLFTSLYITFGTSLPPSIVIWIFPCAFFVSTALGYRKLKGFNKTE